MLVITLDAKCCGIAVSMLDGHMFNTLAALAQRLRKKTDKPFGGIQVRICAFIERGHPFIACSSWSLAIFSNSRLYAKERPSLHLRAKLGKLASNIPSR